MKRGAVQAQTDATWNVDAVAKDSSRCEPVGKGSFRIDDENADVRLGPRALGTPSGAKTKSPPPLARPLVRRTVTARLRINRSALAHNYQLFRERVDGEVGAVVKADAYGVGVVAACEVFAGLGCRHFFVAHAAEGLAVRRLLADVEIFVFEGVWPDTADVLADANLTPVINHEAQLATWRPHRRRPIAVHVDTGMHRLGFAVDLTADRFIDFEVGLLMTHLACADEPDRPENRAQLARFADVSRHFDGVTTSIGNSAGSLLGPEFQGGLVRPGIGLYGGNPFKERPTPVQTVATLEARIVQIRDVPAGATVGYGATNRAERDRRIAVLGLGYADGLPRRLSNQGAVVVNGRRCSIVGRVSMDLTGVDVTDADAAVGDWAEVFGGALSVDEVATSAGTIGYEILTGIGTRVPRVFED